MSQEPRPDGENPLEKRKIIVCSARATGHLVDGKLEQFGQVIPFDFVLIEDTEDEHDPE